MSMSHLSVFLQQIMLHTETNYVAMSHLFIFLQQIILQTETNYVTMSHQSVFLQVQPIILHTETN